MKSLKIIEFGNPLLRQKAKAVTKEELSDKKLKDFLKRMATTMDSEEGIGLAAPQVGVSKTIFLMHMHPTKSRPKLKEQGVVVVVNPKIAGYSKEKQEDWEGCLSLPNVYGKVLRSKTIKVSYEDENGHKVKRELANLEARIFQHEYDHVNGILFVDRMKDMSSLTTAVEFRKLLIKKSR